MLLLRLSLVSFCLISFGYGAKILAIFPMPSKSHHILGDALLRALVKKGHEVTMVSPFHTKKPMENYRDLYLEGINEFKEEKMGKLLVHNLTLFQKFSMGFTVMTSMMNATLGHPVMEMLKTEKFDLLIVNMMLGDALIGYAGYSHCPVIGFSTLGSLPQMNALVGNPCPTSYVPNLMYPVELPMTFFQRVYNVLLSNVLYPIMSVVFEYMNGQLFNNYFKDGPSLDEIRKNVSLIFLNSHYSIESPRPYVPNMIQIGGFHIEEPKKLPAELQNYLDNAKDGAIFFSLGSNLKLGNQPKEKVDAIFNTLGKLKMKVLLKSDKEFTYVPSNIKISKWLPQNDILAHPNVKLFISHGGLLSTTEAIYHGVPIVGIPFFGDQQANVKDAVIAGYAVELQFDDLNETSFSEAINEILTNPKYKKNIELRSSLLREQSMKPLDNAVFWVEHVLKHKGAEHLKNAGVELYWFQYMLLDVILFILAVLYLTFALVRFIIRRIIKLVKCKCCRPKQKDE